MKKIEAYVKPHKLAAITMALSKIEGLRGMSVLPVHGFGRREDAENCHWGIDDLKDFSEHTKIEVFCNDDLVENLIAVIDRNAFTGLRGDGKIYVSEVDRAYKIGKGRIGG